jgi:hypothetical protein
MGSLSRPMGLSALPVDIFQVIVDALGSHERGTLAALARVNTMFHAITMQSLYNHITLEAAGTLKLHANLREHVNRLSISIAAPDEDVALSTHTDWAQFLDSLRIPGDLLPEVVMQTLDPSLLSAIAPVLQLLDLTISLTILDVTLHMSKLVTYSWFWQTLPPLVIWPDEMVPTCLSNLQTLTLRFKGRRDSHLTAEYMLSIFGLPQLHNLTIHGLYIPEGPSNIGTWAKYHQTSSVVSIELLDAAIICTVLEHMILWPRKLRHFRFDFCADFVRDTSLSVEHIGAALRDAAGAHLSSLILNDHAYRWGDIGSLRQLSFLTELTIPIWWTTGSPMEAQYALLPMLPENLRSLKLHISHILLPDKKTLPQYISDVGLTPSGIEVFHLDLRDTREIIRYGPITLGYTSVI